MFHDELLGETVRSGDPRPGTAAASESEARPLTDFEEGLLLGILLGEGHFGGDGRQAQITIKMHVRHQHLFEWLVRVVPGSRLYGPYSYAGRNFYQWMVRGRALSERIVPLLDRIDWQGLDEHVFGRYQEMKKRYSLGLQAKDQEP